MSVKFVCLSRALSPALTSQPLNSLNKSTISKKNKKQNSNYHPRFVFVFFVFYIFILVAYSDPNFFVARTCTPRLPKKNLKLKTTKNSLPSPSSTLQNSKNRSIFSTSNLSRFWRGTSSFLLSLIQNNNNNH